MTKEQIIAAVDAGKPVFWASINYPVIRFAGKYYITCTINTSMIELFDKNGKLNAMEGEFFVESTAN
jgi:hypothetical protein